MIKSPLRGERITRMRRTGLKNSIINWDRLLDSKLKKVNTEGRLGGLTIAKTGAL